MGYNLQFKVETPGIENLAKVRLEVLQLQEQYKAASTEVKQAINRISDAEKQAAEAIALGHKQLAAGIMAGVQQDNEALDSLIRKELELKAAIDQVSGAHTNNVTQVAAASAAIREFEGALPIRAVERFAVTTLGLGPIIQKAFPVFGAIAFAEVLVSMVQKVGDLYNKWNPVIQAEQEALKVSKELNSEYDKLIANRQKAIYDQIAREGVSGAKSTKELEDLKRRGQVRSKLQEASDIDSDATYGDMAAIRDLQKRIGEQEAIVRKGTTSSYDFDNKKYITSKDMSARAADAKIAGLDDQLGVAQLKYDDDRRKAANLRTEAGDIELEANLRKKEDAERKGLEAARLISNETISLRNELANLQAKELTGLDAINAKRLATLEHLREEKKLNSENVDLVNQIAVVEGRLGFEKAARVGHEGAVRLASQAVGQESRDEGRATSFNSRILSDALKKAIVEGEKEVATDRKVIAAYTATEVDEVTQRTRSVIRNNQRDVSSGMISRGSAAASDYNAQVSAANEIYNIEKRRIDLIGDENKREEELANAKKRNAEDVFRAQEQYEDQLQAIRRKSQDEYKQFVVGLTDAAIGGKAGQFLQTFGRQQLDKIVGNVADLTFNSAKNLVPNVPGQINGQGQLTTLGHVLSGTVLGPDPLSGAGVTLTTAGVKLDVAATKLLQLGSVGSGYAGVGSGGTDASVAGLGSIFGGSTQNPFVFNATGTPNLPFVYGASDINDLSGATTVVPGGGGGFGMNARTGLGLAAAGVGAYGAISSFKSGGAKNDIAGVGSALGSAAGVAALFGPAGAPVALGLGIAALATGFIASILPDPKKIRELGIQKTIEQGRYNAPEALNVQQDSSGNYYDYNSRGGIRSSAFSSMPQVSQPYTFWKGNTSYAAPGSVTSPYSAPTINIYAHDSQSFVDMARRNASGLGDVIADHVQNSGTRLSAAISYRVSQ